MCICLNYTVTHEFIYTFFRLMYELITDLKGKRSFSFTFREPPEASARHGEHRRHPRRGGGAVQRQQGLHAEARLDGRPAQRTAPLQSSAHISVVEGGTVDWWPRSYLRRRGGAPSARRRDGRAAEEEALAGAARRQVGSGARLSSVGAGGERVRRSAAWGWTGSGARWSSGGAGGERARRSRGR